MYSRFRWVECQIDSLKKCLTENDIRTALKSLPKTLDETYQRILMSLEEEHRSMAKRALSWLAYAIQPLSIEELATAACIAPEENATPFDPTHQIMEAKWLIDILSSMVIVTPKEKPNDWIETDCAESVILAHFSVREYLNSERLKTSTASMFYVTDVSAQSTILLSSLLYLTEYSTWQGKSLSKNDLYECPILQYAAKFWPDHARAIQGNDITEADIEVLKFLESPDVLRNSLSIFDEDSWSGGPFSERRIEVASPVYYAAFHSLRNTLRAMLQEGTEMINLTGGNYGTALIAACCQENLDIIKILIEAGAEVNIQAGECGTALRAASVFDNLDIVKILIKAGAEVDLQSEEYSTALHASCYYNRNLDIVKILIEAGAEVDMQSGEDGTALQTACYHGRLTIAKFLIEAGAEVNIQWGHYGTALQAACYCGRNLRVIKTLIKAGAEVNMQSGEYGTALQAACSGKDLHVIKTLIKAGAEVNIPGGYYNTALQAACSCYGSFVAIKILIEAGAEVNIQGGRFGNALHVACREGRVTVVKFLIEKGADVNIRYGKALKSLLYSASCMRKPKLVMILLDAGADVNLRNGAKFDGDSPLDVARKRGYPEIVKLLLRAGARDTEAGEIVEEDDEDEDWESEYEESDEDEEDSDWKSEYEESGRGRRRQGK